VIDASDETTRIEHDLEATRARLDATIGALQQKLSPGQLLDQSLAYLKESGGGEFAHNLKHNVQTHPMPVALIGIGLAWLMMSGSGRHVYSGSEAEAWPRDMRGGSDLLAKVEAAAAGVKRTASETAEAFQERLYGAKATALGISRGVGETLSAFCARVDGTVRAAGSGGYSAAQSTRHTAASAAYGARDAAASAAYVARDAAASAAHGARNAATSAAHGARDMTGRAASYFQDQPLLLGALGVSVGALLAAALPSSRTEDELMGGLRDTLRDRAGDAASAAMASGARIAGEVAGAAGEAAEREGLTSVGSRAAEAAAGARHVVEEGLAAGREAFAREVGGGHDVRGERGPGIEYARPAEPGRGV
jgi:hypothetical protein